MKVCVLFICQRFSIQDWLSSDPQDMKELLDKLTQENQQIAQLEAQLQVSIPVMLMLMMLFYHFMMFNALQYIDSMFPMILFDYHPSYAEPGIDYNFSAL